MICAALINQAGLTGERSDRLTHTVDSLLQLQNGLTRLPGNGGALPGQHIGVIGFGRSFLHMAGNFGDSRGHLMHRSGNQLRLLLLLLQMLHGLIGQFISRH